MRTPPLSVNQLLRKAKTFIKRGDLAGAKRSYQSILEKYPGNQQAKAGLKSLQSQQATPQGTGLNQALEHLITLFNQGKLQELIKKAIPLTQQYPDSPLLWNILGSAHFQLEGLNQAADCYTQAIRLNPKIAEPYNNLGTVFNDLGRYEEAIQSYNKALQYRPDYAEAHNNLGNVFKNLNRHEEAIQSYNKALQHQPDYVDAHNNLGTLFNNLGQHEEAIQSYNKALQIQPDYVGAHKNLGVVLLHQGKLAQGWQEYEWRLKKKEYRELIDQIESYGQDLWSGKDSLPSRGIASEINIPLWQGELLQDKTILLWGEQGVGDEVMFASLLPELENSGVRVIVACDNRLVSLFKRSFEFVQAISKSPQGYNTLENKPDFHLPLGSLPKFYRNCLDDFPAGSSYLKANEALVKQWKSRFDALDYGLNIGISWRGGSKPEHIAARSIDLGLWLPVLKGKANFINLQYGDTKTELEQFREQTDIQLHDWDDAVPLQDLENFAAQIKALDMVISVDNSTVHFAGALGIKTWVLLPYVSDWRWLEERTDSPWYPCMRLFRQVEPGDWAGVFKQIEKTLISQAITEI